MWSNIINKSGEDLDKRRKIDDWSGWSDKKIKEIVEDARMENKKLAVGEKYFGIRINVGGQNFDFAAFKNHDKKGREPDYKGQNIGIWVHTKMDKDDKIEVVVEEDL